MKGQQLISSKDPTNNFEKLSEDQAQHLVKIYGEYQEEARHKVLECETRHHEMVATVDLLEHRIRCEEESTLVSKNKAEQERRSVSSDIE